MMDEVVLALFEALQRSNEQLQAENAQLRQDLESLKSRYEVTVVNVDAHLEFDWATKEEVERIRLRLRQAGIP